MKKILLLALLGAFVGFAGCNSDEAGAKLTLKIGNETIDLSGANIYVTSSGEVDRVNDESSDATHSYADVYITDGDAFDGESTTTYYANFYVEFPLDEDASGDFEMSYELLYDASTRWAYFDAYYNITGTYSDFGDTYSWVGWDNTDADGTAKLVVKEGDVEVATVTVKGNMERWDYNPTDGWTLDDEEKDIAVSFLAKGDVQDVSSSQQRVDRPKRLKKFNR